MCWLFPGKAVQINTRCLDCGEEIQIQMKDGGILDANPSTIVGHMNIPFAKNITDEVNIAYA